MINPNQDHYGQANAVYIDHKHTRDQALRQHPEHFVNREPKTPDKQKPAAGTHSKPPTHH
jgi:hypothetical protein